MINTGGTKSTSRLTFIYGRAANAGMTADFLKKPFNENFLIAFEFLKGLTKMTEQLFLFETDITSIRPVEIEGSHRRHGLWKPSMSSTHFVKIAQLESNFHAKKGIELDISVRFGYTIRQIITSDI